MTERTLSECDVCRTPIDSAYTSNLESGLSRVEVRLSAFRPFVKGSQEGSGSYQSKVTYNSPIATLCEACAAPILAAARIVYSDAPTKAIEQGLRASLERVASERDAARETARLLEVANATYQAKDEKAFRESNRKRKRRSS